MYRVLFTIGGFKVYSYGVLLIIAFLVGVAYARRRASRFGIAPDKIWDMAFWALVAGVLGARLLFIVQELPYYLDPAHRAELLSWRFEGLTSFGGLLGGLIAVLIWSKVAKVPTLRLLDLLAAPVFISQAIGRVGCLLNGCCYGGHCDLPWAIHVYGPDGKTILPGLYHPAQVYDVFLNLGALAVLLAWERRSLKAGQGLAAFLMLNGLIRLIYEFWRAGTTSAYYDGLPLTDAQLAAIAIGIVGGVLFFVFGRRSTPEAA